MRRYPFTFKFIGGEITVMAFNRNEGKILAQAEAIKRGWDYEVLECRNSVVTEDDIDKRELMLLLEAIDIVYKSLESKRGSGNG